MTVFEITPDGNGGTKIRERDEDLESILTEYVGQPVKLIPCGGGDRIAAEREQWNDGSNTLCVRPGTVVVYQRNNVTNDVLYKNGINCLVMPSAELSPRPRRPALHVHAGLARGHLGSLPVHCGGRSPLSAASPLRRNSHG